MLGRLIGFLGGCDLQLKLIQLLVGQFLVSDVSPDHFLIAADRRDKISAGPEFVAQEISHLAFDILRNPYRTLPLHISDDLRHRILRRYRYQHMNMIGHQVALLDPALLPSCQVVKHLAQVPFDLPEQQLFAVLRREHDVVLALPSRVIKMIVLCFHHGLLEGSWRFPKETP